MGTSPNVQPPSVWELGTSKVATAPPDSLPDAFDPRLLRAEPPNLADPELETEDLSDLEDLGEEDDQSIKDRMPAPNASDPRAKPAASTKPSARSRKRSAAIELDLDYGSERETGSQRPSKRGGSHVGDAMVKVAEMQMQAKTAELEQQARIASEQLAQAKLDAEERRERAQREADERRLEMEERRERAKVEAEERRQQHEERMLLLQLRLQGQGT